jgi:hypothetical protein
MKMPQFRLTGLARRVLPTGFAPDYIALYRKLERPESGWLAVVDLLVSRWEAANHQTRH